MERYFFVSASYKSDKYILGLCHFGVVSINKIPTMLDLKKSIISNDKTKTNVEIVSISEMNKEDYYRFLSEQ